MLRPERIREFRRLLGERILVLDGAMGTMIQSYKLGEADYRGERFRDSAAGPQGQQRPAGADAPRGDRGDPPALSRGRRRHHRDQHVQFERHLAGRLRPGVAGPGTQPRRLRRLRGEPRTTWRHDTGRARFVAGALGPTNRTASLSPDVNDPGYRAVTFDELVADLRRADPRAGRRRRRPAAGRDHLRHAERQGRAVRHRGRCFDEQRARRCRSWCPVTITDASRTDALRADRRGVLELGAPRTAGRDRPQLRARRQADASVRRGALADLRCVRLRCYPNAGLPNAFGEYDETPGE